MSTDIGEQEIEDLRIKSKEVDALRKNVEELERKLAQQRVWRENADVKVHQLVEENAKLQGRLLELRLESSEASADFRFMLRHSKFLESELRRVKSHMRARKRAREDTAIATREDIFLSSSDHSGSDGEVRTLSAPTTITAPGIRTPIEHRLSPSADPDHPRRTGIYRKKPEAIVWYSLSASGVYTRRHATFEYQIDYMYSVPVIIRTQSQRQCASECMQ
ncbi:hypothetical protein R1sor_009242 [Riccia sorocarpa]|uniref:Uncharacterized protein n=1 Tax=Riccia sorocarpa TaxID=122646 RepID=A0ABD3H5F0_9MARC